MIITNVEFVPNKTITAHLGLVTGGTVRAKNAVKDFGASVKNMFGGEIQNYTELLEEARQEALDRMIAQAAALHADAVINVRFSTSAILEGAAEVYVYGTAVQLQ